MKDSSRNYDVIVVGAGHAGCEAAFASARLGCSTIMFNINLDSIALMSCNPAIGGLAKGQLVKEVDALGGEMGKIADKTAVHFRLLNASKGPAVQSSRFQCDKQLYRLAMKAVVEKEKNLHVRQTLIDRIVVEDGRAIGVEDHIGVFYRGRAIIVTTGTFLNGLIHIEQCITSGEGRRNSIRSSGRISPVSGFGNGTYEDRHSPEVARVNYRFFKAGTAG